ncbi:hypothetical protein [Desulfoferula mesophila]|uniref:hypothetical protein n=1 Tax=Desulfoferula mesophila TaxID=3058419 RepID=UPI0030CF1C28
MVKMSQAIKNKLASIPATTILIITIFFVLALGFHNQFIQDDAFISFRYAENFAHGHGLIWNVGDTEPVEGYTNFLWTLLIVPAIYLDIDPVLWSKILGFIFGLGTLFFTYHVSLKITNSRLAAFLSLLLLGTNYSFSSYITGGLETQLQAFLVILSVYVSLLLFNHNFNIKQVWMLYPVLSILFSLLVMTRLDSVLICSVLFLSISYSVITSKDNFRINLRNFALLVIPSLLISGTWLLFTYLYYAIFCLIPTM